MRGVQVTNVDSSQMNKCKHTIWPQIFNMFSILLLVDTFIRWMLIIVIIKILKRKKREKFRFFGKKRGNLPIDDLQPFRPNEYTEPNFLPPGQAIKIFHRKLLVFPVKKCKKVLKKTFPERRKVGSVQKQYLRSHLDH